MPTRSARGDVTSHGCVLWNGRDAFSASIPEDAPLSDAAPRRFHRGDPLWPQVCTASRATGTSVDAATEVGRCSRGAEQADPAAPAARGRKESAAEALNEATCDRQADELTPLGESTRHAWVSAHSSSPITACARGRKAADFGRGISSAGILSIFIVTSRRVSPPGEDHSGLLGTIDSRAVPRHSPSSASTNYRDRQSSLRLH